MFSINDSFEKNILILILGKIYFQHSVLVNTNVAVGSLIKKLTAKSETKKEKKQ